MTNPQLDEWYRRLAEVRGADRRRLKKRLDGLARKFNTKALPKVAAAIEASVSARARRAGLAATPLNWPDLPVVHDREELAAAIERHQVVVVAGETGSGKTTQLPKICLSLGRGVDGYIGHTQPRRLAARSVTARIAEELNSRVGGLVGYKVRFSEQVGDDTLVKLMTDGMLLSEIQQDRYLHQYDTLIIDEAHERSLNIDFLLGYLKQLLPRRPDLKVIITSECFVIGAADGHTIAVHEWRATDPVGSLIWLHGMAEHGARYQALGETLAEHGWNLYCPDHRGHGASMDAADPPGHFGDQGGWDRVMDDLSRVIDTLREREPGALVLGGHSMGSFLALAGAEAHGDTLDGLVLCGSDYHAPLYYRLMASLLKWQRRRHGARGQSPLVHKLTFEAWARSVPEASTDFDWLSADPAQVKAYIDDPKCGFQCTTATWLALLSGLAGVQSSTGLKRLPSRLPILLLGGRQDPMSGGGKGMDKLQRVLSRRRLPVERMDCPRGRHEILNDFCAPEVRQTLLEWLNRRI